MNVAYRWFLGLDFQDEVPHFTTFGKNYSRRFKDTDLFEQIFYRILDQVFEAKLVEPRLVYLDGTHIKAHANRNRICPIAGQKDRSGCGACRMANIHSTVNCVNKSPQRHRGDFGF